MYLNNRTNSSGLNNRTNSSGLNNRTNSSGLNNRTNSSGLNNRTNSSGLNNRTNSSPNIERIVSSDIDNPKQQYANAEEAIFGTHWNSLPGRISRSFAKGTLYDREDKMSTQNPFINTGNWKNSTLSHDVSPEFILRKLPTPPAYKNDLNIYRTRQNLDVLMSYKKLYERDPKYVPGSDPFDVAKEMKKDIFEYRGD